LAQDQEDGDSKMVSLPLDHSIGGGREPAAGRSSTAAGGEKAGRVQPAPSTPASSHGTPAAGSVHIDVGGSNSDSTVQMDDQFDAELSIDHARAGKSAADSPKSAAAPKLEEITTQSSHDSGSGTFTSRMASAMRSPELPAARADGQSPYPAGSSRSQGRSYREGSPQDLRGATRPPGQDEASARSRPLLPETGGSPRMHRRCGSAAGYGIGRTGYFDRSGSVGGGQLPAAGGLRSGSKRPPRDHPESPTKPGSTPRGSSATGGGSTSRCSRSAASISCRSFWS